jgi:hypothetical protein
VCFAQGTNCTPSHRCNTLVYTTRRDQSAPRVLAITGTTVLVTTSVRVLGVDYDRSFVSVDRGTGVVVDSTRSSECSEGAGQVAYANNVFYWSSQAGICLATFRGGSAVLVPSRSINRFALTSSSIYFSTSTNVEQAPHTVVDTISNVTLFATTPHFVIWCTSGGTLHYRMQSGSPVGVIATNVGRARALAADDSNVYLATSTAILRIALTNGAQTVLVPHEADGLVVDSTELYWYRTNAGEIGKVPVGGGAWTVLSASSGAPGSLVVDGSSVYYAELHNETVRAITPK